MKNPETPLQKWKERRRQVTAARIPLSGKVCQYCGVKDDLTRHHLSYEPIEVIILCRACHQRAHVSDFRKVRPKRAVKSPDGQINLKRFYFLGEIKTILNIKIKEISQLVKDGHLPAWEYPLGEKFAGWVGLTLYEARGRLKNYRKELRKKTKEENNNRDSCQNS